MPRFIIKTADAIKLEGVNSSIALSSRQHGCYAHVMENVTGKVWITGTGGSEEAAYEDAMRQVDTTAKPRSQAEMAQLAESTQAELAEARRLIAELQAKAEKPKPATK